MQVTQPSQEIAESKRNAYTPKAREIARSTEAAESQARLIENDSKGDSVHALEDKQTDYGTRKRGTEIAADVGWKATSHETRNARLDNVLHVSLLWKRRQGQYSADRPLNCWQY